MTELLDLNLPGEPVLAAVSEPSLRDVALAPDHPALSLQSPGSPDSGHHLQSPGRTGENPPALPALARYQVAAVGVSIVPGVDLVSAIPSH